MLEVPRVEQNVLQDVLQPILFHLVSRQLRPEIPLHVTKMVNHVSTEMREVQTDCYLNNQGDEGGCRRRHSQCDILYLLLELRKPREFPHHRIRRSYVLLK